MLSPSTIGPAALRSASVEERDALAQRVQELEAALMVRPFQHHRTIESSIAGMV